MYLFILFDVLVSNILPLPLCSGTRSEWRVGKQEIRNTYSPIPAVPEGVSSNVQANSERECPSDDRTEKDACKVEPGCQQRG